jgi:hypothetical protein
MRALTKDVVQGEVTYFFLVKRTEKDTSAEQKKKGRNDITRVVRQEGGQCRLYSISDASFDFVSVIIGVTAAAAVAEIEKPGTVKATLISGFELFGAPLRGNGYEISESEELSLGA